MQDPLTISYGGSSVERYGAAAKYDFDNPQKWHTESSVPLLDEHEMTNDNGQPVAQVDKTILEQIAANNNKRVRETGDPATLILGHTSDDPRAPEKPAYGFVVNYHVKPFKRDQSGQVIYAIHGDYKIRHKNKELLEQYPRRSVELWWHKKELDPIAMLGGSSPERDLGVVIRNGRINHVALDHTPRRQVSARNSSQSAGEQLPIRFSTRGNYTVECYAIETPRRFARGRSDKKSREAGMAGPSRFNHNCGDDDGGDKYKYADDLMATDEFDGGDEAVPGEGDGPDSAESDPVLAKLFQSKQWKELSQKIDMLAQALAGPEDQGATPGSDSAAIGEEPMPGEMPPPGQPGMGGPGMGAPPPGAEGMDDSFEPEPEEDERRMHGAAPVQMSADGMAVSTGFPGPKDPYISGMNGKKKMTRTTPVQNGRRQPAPTGQNGELAAVKKQLAAFRLKYARSEAEKIVNQLVTEDRILFGRTPEDHEKGVKEQTEYFAHLLMQDGGEEDVRYEVEEVIKKRYSRQKPNPAAPSSVGVARYARQQAGGAPGADDDENFEDTELQDFQKITEFADLIGVRKMSRKDAIDHMRKKYGRGMH